MCRAAFFPQTDDPNDALHRPLASQAGSNLAAAIVFITPCDNAETISSKPATKVPASERQGVHFLELHLSSKLSSLTPIQRALHLRKHVSLRQGLPR